MLFNGDLPSPCNSLRSFYRSFKVLWTSIFFLSLISERYPVGVELIKVLRWLSLVKMTTSKSFCLEDILLCRVATTYCTDPPFPTLSSQLLILFVLVSDDFGYLKESQTFMCLPLLDPHPHTMHKTIVNSPTFPHISFCFQSLCLRSRDTNMVGSNRCQAKGHVGEKQE